MYTAGNNSGPWFNTNQQPAPKSQSLANGMAGGSIHATSNNSGPCFIPSQKPAQSQSLATGMSGGMLHTAGNSSGPCFDASKQLGQCQGLENEATGTSMYAAGNSSSSHDPNQKSAQSHDHANVIAGDTPHIQLTGAISTGLFMDSSRQPSSLGTSSSSPENPRAEALDK